MNTQRHRSEGEIPVVCDVCQTRIYVATDRIGLDVICPDCHTRNRVQAPVQPVGPTTSRYTGDEYRLADDTAVAPTQTSELVKVVCSTCYTLMHAKVEHVGKRVKCPDCGTINRVPRPPEKKKAFQPPDVSDIVVQSGPPPPVDQRKKEIADRLMAGASQEVERRERERPRPPKDPLRDGIYAFPFYANVAPLWIGGTLAITLDAMLLDATIDVIRAGGWASIMAAFMAPVVAIVTFSILGIMAPHFLTIMEFTADGYDKIPYWPSQDLLSRLRAMLFALNAVAMSSLPGMLLVGLLQPLGVPLGFGLISTVLLLPLVTLSMAENDSVFAPYSRFVFGSLRRHGHAWSRFYTQVILLALVVIAVDLAIWAAFGALSARAAAASTMRENVSRVFMIANLSLFAVLYCRLMGRMAWILGQEAMQDDGVEAERTGSALRAE